MTVKDELRPLLLPLVLAERDCTNAVMKNYLDWKHIDYSQATGDITLTRDEWNTLKDGFFFQAGDERPVNHDDGQHPCGHENSL